MAKAIGSAGSKATFAALAILLAGFVAVGSQFGLARSLPIAIAAGLIALWEAWRRLDIEVLKPRREEAATEERYLRALHAWADELPYRALGPDAPPALSSIYVEQRLELASGGAPSSSDAGRAAPSMLPDQPRVGSLADALERHEHVLVEAGPGAGKSTLLKHRVLALAWDPERDRRMPLVPVPVRARALATKDVDMAAKLHEAATAELSGRLQSKLPPELFEGPPTPGARWPVLVDGLDEVTDDSARTALVNEVRMHCENSDSPYRFVLTSRPRGGFGPLEREPFGYYRLLPLELRRVEELARAWFSSRPNAEPEDVHDFLTQLEAISLGDLARTPLLLVLTALIYEQDRARTLPSRRAGLYERFVNAMLRVGELERYAFRSFSEGWRSMDPAAGEESAKQLFSHRRALLEHVALWRQGSGSGALEEEAASYARSEGWVSETVDDVDWLRLQMESLLMSTGIVTRRAGEVAFVHDTFREYLAASALVKEAGDPESERAWELVGEWAKQQWREVVLFALGIWSEQGTNVTKVIRRIVQDWEGPLFAGTAIAQGACVAPETREAIIDDLFARSQDSGGNPLFVLAMFRGDARVVQGVRSMAEDSGLDEWRRLEAAKALGRLGLADEAARILSQLARDAAIGAWARVVAAKDLGDLRRTSEAVDLLREFCREWFPTWEGREAARALSEMGETDEAVELLHRFAEEAESARMKVAAVALLAEFGHADRALPVLEALLEQARRGQLEEEKELIAPLRRLGRTDDAVAIMLKVVQDPRERPFLRWNVAADLVKLSREDELVKLADDRPADARVPALVGLAFWRADRPDRSTELLTDYARDPTRDLESRVRCAQALMDWGGYEEGEALLAAMSQDPELEIVVRENRRLVDRELGT